MIKREAAAYLVVGAVTTVINMAVYYICYNMADISNLFSNGMAWVLAVVFANFAK
ncbi:MAG: GtrA family protein [Acetivibrio ethanolgignens]